MISQIKIGKFCTVSGCSNPEYLTGYCRIHYEANRRYGDPTVRFKAPRGAWAGMVCEIEGCNSPVKYQMLCGKHYKRKWRHGDPEKTLLNMESGTCVVEDCARPRKHSDGLCAVHWQRQRIYGRYERIKNSKGTGRTEDSNGYRQVWFNGNLVYEHIYLAEQALGKPLPTGAIVHHMNRDKQDNHKYFNLVVCPDQAYHMLLHQRMAEIELRERKKLADELYKDIFLG